MPRHDINAPAFFCSFENVFAVALIAFEFAWYFSPNGRRAGGISLRVSVLLAVSTLCVVSVASGRGFLFGHVYIYICDQNFLMDLL